MDESYQAVANMSLFKVYKTYPFLVPVFPSVYSPGSPSIGEGSIENVSVGLLVNNTSPDLVATSNLKFTILLRCGLKTYFSLFLSVLNLTLMNS